MTANIEEHHTQQHQRQIEGLGLEVLLVEEKRTKHETHHHATSDHDQWKGVVSLCFGHQSSQSIAPIIIH